MTAAALIGDQLILEEEYDETYIPSEQGMKGRGGFITWPWKYHLHINIITYLVAHKTS